MHNSEALGILAFFGSFWLAVTLISIAVIGSRYYFKRHAKQLGYNLAMEAFHRGATATEVECLLWAWNGDAKLAKLQTCELVQSPPPKALSAGQGAYSLPAEMRS